MKSAPNIIKKLLSASLIAPVVFLATGCASVSRESVQANLDSTQLAIEQAHRYDSDEHAALELKMADDKLKQAKAAMDSNDYQRADWLVEEASANIQLAEAIARSNTTQMAVAELKKSLDLLKIETQRLQQNEPDLEGGNNQ